MNGISTRAAPHPSALTGARLRRWASNPHFLLTTALGASALLVLALNGTPGSVTLVVGATLATLLGHTVIGRLGRPVAVGHGAITIEIAHHVATLGLVVILVTAIPDRGVLPLLALYIPVVSMAAAGGPIRFATIGGLALVAIVVPAVATGSLEAVRTSAIIVGAVTVMLGVGTLRTTSELRRTIERSRALLAANRRRARQFAGLEEVGRILAEAGPTPAVLDQIMGVLTEQSAYHHVSLHLLDGSIARLAAQRGYDVTVDFDGTSGIIGRVMRTRVVAFVPDVATDPDYQSANADVRSEICVPLLAHGELLAILNVEASGPRALDSSDRATVVTVADRLAVALALARERASLAERADMFRRLLAFAAKINGVLAPDQLYRSIIDAVDGVVSADLLGLTVLDRTTATYRVRAANGADHAIDRIITPGEGLAGRAIRERAVIKVEHYGRDAFPTTLRADTPADEYASALGVPLVRDGAALGALTVGRLDPARLFTGLELEALELLAGDVTLALSNAFLHAEVAELAIRDGLTGLHNRRYFDEAFPQLIAARARLPATIRPPLSIILFDLDHFGAFNNDHGHQVGDAVLRRFGQIIADRVRASDLGVRYGGEEFVVVLPGAARDGAAHLADEIRLALASATVGGADGAPLSVTVSAGCATMDEAEPTGEALIRAADMGLIMAKRSGRNRVVVT